MDEGVLRMRNRALIKQLMDGQKAAHRSTYDASKLSRHLDTIQHKLNELSMGRVTDVSPSKSSSSPRLNFNNNNITDSRFSKPTVFDLTSPSSSPDTLLAPSDRLTVLRSGTGDSRTVRRKLADEMASTGQDHQVDVCTQTPPRRSALKNTTNEQQTPEKLSRSTQATPKSILKHRKLIDNNIQVQSKYDHTPGWIERAKHTRLRCHRSDAKSCGRKERKQMASRRLPSKADKGDLSSVSYWPSSSDPPADPLLPTNADQAAASAALKAHVGNVRCSRSPTHTADISAGLAQGELTPNRNTMPTPTSLSQVGPSPETPTQSVVKQRMMGYDWIAALLDQSEEMEMGDKHESYFRELREFRRVHRDECENDAIALPSGDARSSLVDTANISPAKPEALSPNHTCIHSYTVNPRLYAVPMNADRTGESRCAVCNKRKQLPSTSSPSFVRVSIPRCTLSSPYRVKPHRRKSFDPSDSVALSKHCLAGWVHQRPLKLPIGRNVDLANETNRLKTKFTMTMAEAENFARKAKASNAVTSRDIDQTTLYSREVKKVTNQLLDMSHALQFQTQLLNKTPVH